MGVTLDLDDKFNDIGLFEVWANKIRAQKVIHIIKMERRIITKWETRRTRGESPGYFTNKTLAYLLFLFWGWQGWQKTWIFVLSSTTPEEQSFKNEPQTLMRVFSPASSYIMFTAEWQTLQIW